MEKWQHSEIVDAVLAPFSAGLILAYHLFLFYKVRTQPSRTLIGINHKARRLWIYEMLRDNNKRNVLAVQTLRNSIMESTLMATTAVLLTAGLATYFTFTSSMKQLPGAPSGSRSASISLSPLMSSTTGTVSNTIKTFAVLSCFMLSFLCHTQSIRFLNHVNYMVNVSMDHHHLITPDSLADIMERSTFMYTIGSRSFYVAFPLLLWVFGSIPMFLCALVLLHAFYNFDFVCCKSPTMHDPEKGLQDHQHDVEHQQRK